MLGEVEEAVHHPNGWVYRIQGVFGPKDAVPPEAIVGAWKVDGEGKIVGEFVPNAKFSGAGNLEMSAQSTGSEILTVVRVILAVVGLILLAGGVITAVSEKNWKVTVSSMLLGGLFVFLAWIGRTPSFLK